MVLLGTMTLIMLKILIKDLTGYMFTIGGCAINWTTTLQITVALLTTKVEYKVITEGLRKLFG